jgi:peptidoglycan/xylan/chitin deacetylase (PgdA/CDA1 family)
MGTHCKKKLGLAVSLIYFFGMSALKVLLLLVGRPPDRRLTILYYHGISSALRYRFAGQMEALRRDAQVVPTFYQGDLVKEKSSVAISFDDAFVSVLENAVPELVRRNLCFTIFAPVGVLGKRPTWMMESSSTEADEIVMTPEQLLMLPTKLATIGSHSVSHPQLTKITENLAREEIDNSRARLQSVIGREVRLFAFPYGEHNTALVDMCNDAGYKFVFTIIPEPTDTLSSDIVRGRIKVEPSDGQLEFFLKYNGAYAWMAHFTRFKQWLRAAI